MILRTPSGEPPRFYTHYFLILIFLSSLVALSVSSSNYKSDLSNNIEQLRKSFIYEKNINSLKSR